MNPESKKHLSPLIAWAIVALMAGIAGFCIWYYFDQVTTIYDNIVTTGSVKKTTKPAAATSTVSTADWKTYTNDYFGFSLNLTDEWKNYKAHLAPSTSFETALITFSMPTTDKTDTVAQNAGGGYEYIFNILVFTPNQWSAVQNGTGLDEIDLKKDVKYIDEKNGYVFGYAKGEIVASDLKAINFQIDQVIKTIKFYTPTADWQSYAKQFFQ